MEEVLNTKRGRGRPATGRKKRRYISVAERGLPDRRNGNPGHKSGGRRLPDRGSLKVQAVLGIPPEMFSALQKYSKKLGITRHEFVERAVLDYVSQLENSPENNADSTQNKAPLKAKSVFRNFQIPKKILIALKKRAKELKIRLRVLVERAVFDYLTQPESTPGINTDSVPFGAFRKAKIRFRVSSETITAIRESAKQLKITQSEFVSRAVERGLVQPESTLGINTDSVSDTGFFTNAQEKTSKKNNK